ncbi:MAG: ABC transporter substrate-binding protein [bacterium]
MKNKFWVSIVTALVVVIGLACVACKQNASSSLPLAVQGKPVKIGVIVYPGYGPLFIAKEKGFFDKEGVKVEISVLGDASSLISSFASNDVQFSICSPDATLLFAEAGVDFKEIWAMDIGYGSDGLLVKNDVNSVSDLKGKPVYLYMGTPSHFLLRSMAIQAGLKAGDISLIQMDPDQIGAAFMAGKIDYGMSWEPWLSKASARKDGKTLFTSKDKPGIILDTFAVRTDFLNAHRDQVKAIMRAWFDSIEFLKTNSKEAHEIMARNFHMPIEELETQLTTVKFLSYQESLAKFSKDTDLNVFQLAEMAAKIFKEDGVLKKDVHPESLVDGSLLKELHP